MDKETQYDKLQKLIEFFNSEEALPCGVSISIGGTDSTKDSNEIIVRNTEDGEVNNETKKETGSE